MDSKVADLRDNRDSQGCAVLRTGLFRNPEGT